MCLCTVSVLGERSHSPGSRLPGPAPAPIACGSATTLRRSAAPDVTHCSARHTCATRHQMTPMCHAARTRHPCHTALTAPHGTHLLHDTGHSTRDTHGTHEPHGAHLLHCSLHSRYALATRHSRYTITARYGLATRYVRHHMAHIYQTVHIFSHGTQDSWHPKGGNRLSRRYMDQNRLKTPCGVRIIILSYRDSPQSSVFVGEI